MIWVIRLGRRKAGGQMAWFSGIWCGYLLRFHWERGRMQVVGCYGLRKRMSVYKVTTTIPRIRNNNHYYLLIVSTGRISERPDMRGNMSREQTHNSRHQNPQLPTHIYSYSISATDSLRTSTENQHLFH